MFGFGSFAIASLFWSSYDQLNIDKTLRFMILTSMSFYISLTLAEDKERGERLMRLVGLLSCAILLYYGYYRWILGINITRGLWDPERSDGSTENHEDNYQEYGEHAAILFILFLAVAVFGPARRLPVNTAGASAALFALVSIGGRGALMIALLSIPLLGLGLLFCSREVLRFEIRLLFFSCAVIAVAAVGYMLFTNWEGSDTAWEQFHTLNRYDAQLSGESTTSIDHRLELQIDAFFKWQEKPLFGWGIGEFRIQHTEFKYPHNLLLEILMEMGLIGALLFIALCATAIVNCIRIAREGPSNWVNAAVVLLFITDFISHISVMGYLADDRIFFTYIALTIGLRSDAKHVVGRPVRTRRNPDRRGARATGARGAAVRCRPL
jgi:hypothetical protein